MKIRGMENSSNSCKYKLNAEYYYFFIASFFLRVENENCRFLSITVKLRLYRNLVFSKKI